MVAAYESTMGKRTMANYKCKTWCRGYSIKQYIWNDIMSAPIADHIKDGVKVYYYNEIYRKI